MSGIACPEPYSHYMMNEATAINQSLEKDVRGLDLPLLGAPSESNGAPALEFLWTHLAKDVQFSPTQCLNNECIASIDVGSYASANDEFNNGFVLESSPAEPPLFDPGRTIKQPADQGDPLSPLVFISGNPDSGVEILPDRNDAHDTTSSEPSLNSTKSARHTTSTSTSTSPITSVDQSGAAELKQHRERNRVAARKCRQKAKKNINGLQRRERELSQQNRMLLSYATSLREEILDLKTEILRHSDCNSNIIQSYIANAARRQME
ncbi:hypothetical protein F4803DRAFT_499184 [Xylaria telfairii]|nr:hypothetical protein F4803DRAFT_499184 [Xylaria telfairii]